MSYGLASELLYSGAEIIIVETTPILLPQTADSTSQVLCLGKVCPGTTPGAEEINFAFSLANGQQFDTCGFARRSNCHALHCTRKMSLSNLPVSLMVVE